MEETESIGDYQSPIIEGSFHQTLNQDFIEANMSRIANGETTDVTSISDVKVEECHQVQAYIRIPYQSLIPKQFG